MTAGRIRHSLQSVPTISPPNQIGTIEFPINQLNFLSTIEWAFGIDFEENPTHVSPEKFLRNIVGIVGMLVVPPMIGDPTKSGVFESAGSKNQGRKVHGPFDFKGEMREQSVIAECDAEAGRDDVKQHQTACKPIDPEFNEINGGAPITPRAAMMKRKLIQLTRLKGMRDSIDSLGLRLTGGTRVLQRLSLKRGIAPAESSPD